MGCNGAMQRWGSGELCSGAVVGVAMGCNGAVGWGGGVEELPSLVASRMSLIVTEVVSLNK